MIPKFGKSDDRASREHSRIVAVVGCQTGLLLLGVVLTGVARESTIAPDLQGALPIVNSVLLFWCFAQLVTIGPVLRSPRATQFARMRTSIDLTFSLAIIWLTGGVVSFFLPLLFAGLLATSTLLGLRRAVAIASIATIALAAMTSSQLLGWHPAEWTGAVQRGISQRSTFLISTLIGQGIGLHLVAFLGARLTSRLERAERLSAKIVECIGDGVVAIDDNGRIVMANRGALSLFPGAVGREIIGNHPQQVWRRKMDAPLLEILTNPTEGLHPIDFRDRDGSRRHVTVESRVLDAPRMRHEIWVHVLRDRTFEERAARAELRLRHLQAVEDLSVGLVHEVRNPLAAIRGGVQELVSDRLSEGQREQIGRIVDRESERLGRIVDEFLESASASPTRYEDFDLREVLEEIGESLAQRSQRRDLVLLDLPDSPVVLEGHREQIHRLFSNLGSNAVEAMSGREGRVRLSLASDGVCAQVRVSDDGCGMDPTTRDRAFNPFFTTKPREGGLGLPYVERIVEGHRGTLLLETDLGRGTTFTVELPLHALTEVASDGRVHALA